MFQPVQPFFFCRYKTGDGSILASWGDTAPGEPWGSPTLLHSRYLHFGYFSDALCICMRIYNQWWLGIHVYPAIQYIYDIIIYIYILYYAYIYNIIIYIYICMYMYIYIYVCVYVYIYIVGNHHHHHQKNAQFPKTCASPDVLQLQKAQGWTEWRNLVSWLSWLCQSLRKSMGNLWTSWVPSGKHTKTSKSDWKSQFLIGKSTINGHFQ